MSKIPVVVNSKVIIKDRNATTMGIEAQDDLRDTYYSRSEEGSTQRGWILNLDLRQMI